MISTSANNFYYYASDTTTFTRFTTNSTAYPFPQFVTALAMILLIVGNSDPSQVWPWWPATTNAPPSAPWPSLSFSSHSQSRTFSSSATFGTRPRSTTPTLAPLSAFATITASTPLILATHSRPPQEQRPITPTLRRLSWTQWEQLWRSTRALAPW